MSLETYESPSDLYLARAEDVNSNRPFFTGDVFAEVPIAGVQANGMAIIIAHPCSMRGAGAVVRDSVLVAPVGQHADVGRGAWPRGYYDLMPLPELVDSQLHVGRFHEMGRAPTEALESTDRVACLTVFGINLLQQRLIWHLARLEVETHKLYEAFVHTFEEADLLEEWNDAVSPGVTIADAGARFEAFLRTDRGGGRNLQTDLRDPQRRSSVRTAVRAEARRVAAEFEGGPYPGEG